MTSKRAKRTCKRLYQEHTANSGSGNKPIPPEQQVRQRRNQQFEGYEEHRISALMLVQEGDTTPSSTTHSCSSSSSRWQPRSDLWSTWNWDSWESSSWSDFFELFQMSDSYFACPCTRFSHASLVNRASFLVRVRHFRSGAGQSWDSKRCDVFRFA